MMQTSVGRMASLIDNVLDFARGRLGGGITLVRSFQPLEPMLRQVIEELQSTHPETVITAEFELAKPVNADPVRIGQLFSNLLGNALTHGSPGTPVTVTAKTTDHFELLVCNAGNPIAPEAMERLFFPFFPRRSQAKPARARPGPTSPRRSPGRTGA
jgi:phosphoserine phosphatase RsbU/P